MAKRCANTPGESGRGEGGVARATQTLGRPHVAELLRPNNGQPREQQRAVDRANTSLSPLASPR